MSIIKKVAKIFSKSKPQPPANDQALIVEVQLPASEDGLFEKLSDFEEQVIHQIESASYGEFDGNEIATDGSHARFYIYAPRADMMSDLVAPLFLKQPLVKDASFLLRYGQPGDASTKERTIAIKALRKMYDVKR